MKPVRQFKPVRGKLAKQESKSCHHDPAILAKALRKEFQHPFRITRANGKTLISWNLGPYPEKVWAFILQRFPVLAVEEIMATRWGWELYDGYMAFPLPSFLNRRDLFNARVEDIPYLASLGADMNVQGFNGTPLENAITRADDQRALALALAGADVSNYGPDGPISDLGDYVPAFWAFIEQQHLSKAAGETEAANRPRLRL